ncbi:DUF1059 domain-containing protein [Imperialibacter roseus]|uniref:DUF1059 domain-containing protein n=1 Tax=Imperialibacter roseus TaxID=1324217 RepID=A0ABZ0ISG8_9BACT|nr:DUF1059 domain-containing protein [Imperialibacter roseus]WOK07965.1 DUF1059 domain-containing protein [Imperialibacter roseus]
MMKTMTCRQLGGACDKAFQAATFDEIAQLSKTHGTEMFKKGDAAHLEAMQAMSELMKSPDKMKAWFEAKKREFETLPDHL